MSTTIFPESGDQITEAAWSAQNQSLTVAERYRVSGYTLSAGTGLNANVAAGTCVVNGYHIVSDATQAVSVTASQTNYIWLNADGTLSSNTTGTNPGNELLLGTAVTDGSGVTSVSHKYDIKNAQNVLIVKPSDETVNNSSTFQDDDDFQFTVEDGSQWFIRLFLKMDSNSATPGFKFQPNISGGSFSDAGTFMRYQRISGGYSTSTDGTMNFGGTGTDHWAVYESHVFVTTGGTLAIQWAQDTANASNSIVAEGSILSARRVLG